MNTKQYISKILPKIINYKIVRCGIGNYANPITLTYAVTYRCQSRCKTCKIWELYKKYPEMKVEELTIDEIKKIFKRLGHVYFFNISGGEPFLRKDLFDIVKAAISNLQPGIIHIPTNALLPVVIEREVNKILTYMDQINYRVPFTVKPSMDGIGDEHDRIRGVKGNFSKLIDTVYRLKVLQKKYDFFHLELGTVISNENIHNIDQIAEFAHSLGVESYRNEIAEQRSEFFNIGDPITPSAEEYTHTIKVFSKRTRENIKTKKTSTKITESLRLVYYDIVIKILQQNRQVIPCYAGISNVQMNPFGDIWPCCVLGFEQSMGNMREYDYDFKKLYHSKQANKVRKYIKEGNCACPLANQAYSNIMCHFPSMFKFIRQFVMNR